MTSAQLNGCPGQLGSGHPSRVGLWRGTAPTRWEGRWNATPHACAVSRVSRLKGRCRAAEDELAPVTGRSDLRRNPSYISARMTTLQSVEICETLFDDARAFG